MVKHKGGKNQKIIEIETNPNRISLFLLIDTLNSLCLCIFSFPFRLFCNGLKNLYYEFI